MVRALCVFMLSIAGLVGATVRMPAQESPAGGEAASFFSGVVTELASGSITVSRTILGKSAETRTFTINSETRVEGQLKVKSRVTVRFAPGDDGDVAVSIVVRDDKKSGGKK